MTTATVALLALAALAYVVAALRRGGPGGEAGVAGAAAEAEARKRSALTAIVDLLEERELGKLAPADFDELAPRYDHEAVAALRELDALRDPPARDELEGEIAEVRRRLECPSCGGPRSFGTSCPRCGS